MNGWNWIIVILCFSAGMIWLRMEFRRPNRKRIWARMMATGIAITGLCGLGLKFEKHLPGETKQPSENKIIVNTKSPAGFLDIHWNRELYSGQPLNIQGRYKNANDSAIKIYLNVSNSVLDTVQIPAGMEKAFSLFTIPKQTGKALFQLVVKRGNHELEIEPLPVVIQHPDSLNLLILAAYPDFENKFLVQWLAGSHIRIVQRTRISRERFAKQFYNRQPFEFNRINDNLLNPFDMLICDVASWLSLSADEQKVIRRQVNENGMGLLLRADSAGNKKTFYESRFPLYRFSAKTSRQRTLITNDSSGGMEYPGVQDLTGIRFQPGSQPLVQDMEGRILVNSQLEGRGKICYTALNNTFEWSLGGKQSDYGQYWTYLIHKTAKQKKEPLQLRTVEKFPVKDHPVHFMLETSSGHHLEPSVGKTAFYPEQDKNLSNKWSGVYWPEQTGWQPAVHAGDQYMEWYVFDGKDWPGFTQQAKQVLPLSVESAKDLKLLYFLLFYISGWVFLWLERKLSLI